MDDVGPNKCMALGELARTFSDSSLIIGPCGPDDRLYDVAGVVQLSS